MKSFRTALLPRVFIWLWSVTFSVAAISLASAQEDQAPQSQASIEADIYSQPNAEPSYDSNQNQPESSRSYHDQADQNDPPGRAARLQYMNGSVSIQPRGTEDWVQGSLNRPLTIADNIWADKNSRAELNVGTGIIRIGSETSLTLTNVNDGSVQLSLHQGAMNLHVRHLYRGEIYEVDTPNQAFTILKTGDYRFDVDPNADTTLITVWRGEGESTGQGKSVRIKEHQQAQFRSGNSLAHELRRALRPDGFDDWCQVRNRRTDESVSARYVSPDVVGSEDLDAYGTWRRSREYGSVWVPTVVDSGWAPYTTGHWVFIEPWGWTWVDDAPWGYAPFHYGRWIHEEGYWGWAPGPYYGGWERGYYAPALVAWFGGGGWGVNLGFGVGGGYGWCALGWGEPFVPWYHSGWGYFRNVNVYNTQIVNINNYRNVYVNNVYNNNGGNGKPPYGGGGYGNGGNGKPPYGGGGYGNGGNKPPYGGGGYGNSNGKPTNGTGLHYANLNVKGGFTAVSRNTIEGGLPVRQNAVRVGASDIHGAPMVSRVGVSPTLQSRLGPNAGRPAAAAPATAMSRPVISRMPPPAPARGAFSGGSSSLPRVGASNPGSIGKPSAGISSPSARGQISSPAPIAAGRPSPQPSNSSTRYGGAPSVNRNFPVNSASNAINGTNTPIAAGRNVPRPPSLGQGSIRAEPMRTASAGPTMNQPAPNASSPGYRGGASSIGRSVPRPPSGYAQNGSYSSNSPSNNRNAGTSQPSRGNWSGAGSNVPRPTGQVAPAPRNYSSGGSSPSYSRTYPSGGNSPSYSRSYPSAGSQSPGRYNAVPQYSSPRSPAPSYGGGGNGGSPYGGSRSAPSQSGRSYGGGGNVGGSYGGGPREGGYSAPSHSSSSASSGRPSGGSQGSNHSGGHH